MNKTLPLAIPLVALAMSAYGHNREPSSETVDPEQTIQLESIRYDASAGMLHLTLRNNSTLDITAFSVEILSGGNAASNPPHSETIDLIHPYISHQLGATYVGGERLTLNAGESFVLKMSLRLPIGFDASNIQSTFPLIVFADRSYNGRKEQAAVIARQRENSWQVQEQSLELIAGWLSSDNGPAKLRAAAKGALDTEELDRASARTRAELREMSKQVSALLEVSGVESARKYIDYQFKRLSKLRESSAIQGVN